MRVREHSVRTVKTGIDFATLCSFLNSDNLGVGNCIAK